jgi:uncharacterized membrane protein
MVASLSYALGFVTGIVILMVEPNDKFIRFHATQSTLTSGSLFVLNIILGLLFSKLGIFSFVSTISGLLIWALIVVSCIVGFLRAREGRVYKFPFFGKYAEKRVA